MKNENNDYLYKTLKNMTLEELVSIFKTSNQIGPIRIEEKINTEDSMVLYTINELIDKYPFFTRYNINKAIENGGLPYCFIGNKRMFNKEEIEKWLEKETKPKKEKIKYDI